MRPTPLERAILAGYHEAFRAAGFPEPDSIDVLKRDNTDAGRFVDPSSGDEVTLEGRTCDIPFNIEMEGVEHGLGVVLFMDHGRIDCLELFTYAGDWDGEERPQRLVPNA